MLSRISISRRAAHLTWLSFSLALSKTLIATHCLVFLWIAYFTTPDEPYPIVWLMLKSWSWNNAFFLYMRSDLASELRLIKGRRQLLLSVFYMRGCSCSESLLILEANSLSSFKAFCTWSSSSCCWEHMLPEFMKRAHWLTQGAFQSLIIIDVLV